MRISYWSSDVCSSDLLAVEPFGFPARLNARLFLRESGFHREIGLRQEDGVSVVALFSHRGARLEAFALPRNPSPSARSTPRACRTSPRRAGSGGRQIGRESCRERVC